MLICFQLLEFGYTTCAFDFDGDLHFGWVEWTVVGYSLYLTLDILDFDSIFLEFIDQIFKLFQGSLHNVLVHFDFVSFIAINIIVDANALFLNVC